MDAALETLVIYGLVEIADDPIAQGTVPDSLICVRGDEDRWDTMSGINQMSVELDPCHSGHLNVCDQASGLRQKRRCEETRRRRKCFDRVPQQTHELLHGFAKRLIIL